MRAIVKKMIYKAGLSPVLDQFIFRYRKFKNKNENEIYRAAHPYEKIPPDYYLYETFQLHYLNFFEQGELTAKELSQHIHTYVHTRNLKVLEWGCGVARVCRYIDKYFPGSQVFGCDINEKMIEWDKANISNVSFTLINYDPPTPYPDQSFGFVYGLSVFTHIEDAKQEEWLKEIHRILASGGIFLFSTHGKKYVHQLTASEQRMLEEKGAVTKSYYQKGHRLMGAYNQAAFFRKIIERYFDVLEYYDGARHLEKLGGQDMWIVKKK